MFCPKCGKELREGSRFCNHCGQSLQSIQIDPEVFPENPEEGVEAYAHADTADKEPAFKFDATDLPESEKKPKRKKADRDGKPDRPALKLPLKPVLIGVALVVIVLIAVFAARGSDPYCGKGIRFGMSDDKVEKILSKYFETLHSLGGVGIGVDDSQYDEFSDLFGKEIASAADFVSYDFTDDKLCRVTYTLKGSQDTEDVCGAFGIPYQADEDPVNGYYTYYTKDDVFAEVHVNNGNFYKEDTEEFYVYFEPTYDVSGSGKGGHKHKWIEPSCDREKVCESCGETRPNYRYHEIVRDSDGICVNCGKDIGIPLTKENVRDYIDLYSTSFFGPDNDGEIALAYYIKLSPVSGEYRFTDTKLGVYCDARRSSGDIQSDNWLGNITVDEKGYAECGDAVYNTDSLDNIRLIPERGARVHVPGKKSGEAEEDETAPSGLAGELSEASEESPSENMPAAEAPAAEAPAEEAPAKEPAAQEPEAEKEKSYFPDWKSAYLAYLKGEAGNEGFPSDSALMYQYQLIYLDDDDIPELILSTSDTVIGQRILTWHEEELKEEDAGFYTSYIAGSGLFDAVAGIGFTSEDIIKLENGEFKHIASGNIGYDYDTGDEIYDWDGKTVTKDEYYSNLNRVFPESESKKPDELREYDDFLKFLEDY
ncbi:MAG: zinc ribbon domain-containing protein [Lachnospiraceae bacterium]|nr:zinc ribbon domain-containing protein [Lachnospiraceae bacterium]